MKKLFYLLSIPLFLVSCQKEDIIESPDKLALLELSFVAQQDIESKASTPLLSQTGDNNLDRVIVFIFNASSGIIESTRVLMTPDLVVNSIIVAAPVGVKDIYIVGNPKSADMIALTGVVSVEDLKNKSFDLRNEVEGSFVMLGKKLGVSVVAGTTNLVQIDMSRAAARIYLTNITAQFVGEMVGRTLAIDTIYLMRSIGTKSYGDSTIVVAPEKVYNRVASGFAFQNYDIFATPVNISSTQTFASALPNGVHYYTYANGATTFAAATKLVIAATVNGVRTYYPIAVNVAGNGHTPSTAAGVWANYDYRVTVVIKGMGSSDPNIPVSGTYCSITISPKVWSIFNEQVIYQ